MHTSTKLFLAVHAALISMFVGGCAVESDLETVEHESAGASILLPAGGTGQDREVMSSFNPLAVTVLDTAGNPRIGAIVSFTSPAAGASATFRFDGLAETDETGRAELRPYANSIAGSYLVWAHADGADPMPFVLTNTAGPPARIVPVIGSHQWRMLGQVFPQPLTVEVRDNWGNLVADAPILFVAPADGATTRMSEEGNSITDDEGRASVFATAGSMAGTYTVLAKVPGAPSALFVLSNMDGRVLPDLGRSVVDIHTITQIDAAP